MPTSHFLKILTFLILVSCSITPKPQTDEKRSPASAKKDLEVIFSNKIETFSRAVKLYTWHHAAPSEVQELIQKRIVSAWEEPTTDSCGPGFYAAIDPDSTKKYGPNVIVTTLPKGFRFLNVSDHAVIDELNEKLPEYNLPDPCSKNVDEDVLTNYKSFFAKFKIQAIRYSYIDPKKKNIRDYAFVIVAENPSVMKHSVSSSKEAKQIYRECSTLKTCAIGTSNYPED